jgi:molybdopterin-guanine dinucleotide biosynthesis protein A
MGVNKALIQFQGELLIMRIYHRLAALAGEVLVTVNQASGLEELGLSLVTDHHPGKGALGGLYTGLLAAQNPLVAVVGCDMPFVNPKLLQAELDIIAKTRVDAVIPHSAAGLEPLHAVYRRETCLQAVHRALMADQLRLVSWLADVNVHEIPLAQVEQYDPGLRAFFNLNTPEDVKQAESMALHEADQSNNLSG